jgi:hypothetical protein
MRTAIARDPLRVVLSSLFVLAFVTSVAVLICVMFEIFTYPGESLHHFGVLLETRFLPPLAVLIVGAYALAQFRWPGVWFQFLSIPAAIWGAYALKVFLAP